MLDNFDSVAEAVAWINDTQVQTVPQPDPFDGRAIGLPLALEDGTGDSAIVEYLDGTANVRHTSLLRTGRLPGRARAHAIRVSGWLRG